MVPSCKEEQRHAQNKNLITNYIKSSYPTLQKFLYFSFLCLPWWKTRDFSNNAIALSIFLLQEVISHLFKMSTGPYIYDIHEKCPIFTPPSLALPEFSVCPNIYIFSRSLHHIPCPCNSELFITKNQFKLKSIFCTKTQANTSHLEC